MSKEDLKKIIDSVSILTGEISLDPEAEDGTQAIVAICWDNSGFTPGAAIYAEEKGYFGQDEMLQGAHEKLYEHEMKKNPPEAGEEEQFDEGWNGKVFELPLKDALEVFSNDPQAKILISSASIKFSSKIEAVQHLANITGKNIRIAEENEKASSTDIDELIKAYIVAMLWSTNDESDEYGGEPMDANYDPSDISSEFMSSIKSDCKKFVEDNYEFIKDDLEMAGHDFWLTRNGHGAGFWDGDWEFEIDGKNAGEHLTEVSKAAGEVNAYVGDDGKIYGL